MLDVWESLVYLIFLKYQDLDRENNVYHSVTHNESKKLIRKMNCEQHESFVVSL